MNCKFALLFLVVLAVALKSSQGKTINISDIKDNLEDGKKQAVATKVGLVSGAAAKAKLLALKKLAAVKTIVKAPFVLGKKAILLKAKAIKSLAALKAAKAKKVLSFAGKKIAPAVALVTGIPSAAMSALRPKPASYVDVAEQTEVLDNIYASYPAQGQNYHLQQHQIPINNNYHYYRSGLDAPRTYSNDYSLVPERNSGSQYYPVSDIIQPFQTYGVPAN